MKKKEIINYFDEFIKAIDIAKESTKEVKNYISNFNANQSKEMMQKIHQLENTADDNQHRLKNFLLKDFLPPIDREDILEIANRIDDLVDGIDEIIININILNITKIEINMVASFDLLEDAINNIHDLIELLKKFKNADAIKEKIIEINGIEEKADRLYEESISQLYKNEKDAILIIKWDKLYEMIENCFDICESISNAVEEVLMKNS